MVAFSNFWRPLLLLGAIWRLSRANSEARRLKPSVVGSSETSNAGAAESAESAGEVNMRKSVTFIYRQVNLDRIGRWREASIHASRQLEADPARLVLATLETRPL